MAGPPKRRAVAQSDSTSESSESNEEEQLSGQEMIQAEFEGRNLESEDFHGIKQLLQQLFLKAHIDLSQMTDLLISQSGIGSVLKQGLNDEDEDDDETMSDPQDVFGVTSVLNLTSHAETPCVKQLITLIQDLSRKHADTKTQAEIEKVLQSKKIGLLLNERFINIPMKISDPLLSSLSEELERIQKKDPSYAFDYLTMICKLHKPKGDTIGVVHFANGEEEVFDKQAEFSFEFNVTAESDTSVSGKWTDGDIEMIPYRKVLFIKAEKLNNLVQRVKTFLI